MTGLYTVTSALGNARFCPGAEAGPGYSAQNRGHLTRTGAQGASGRACLHPGRLVARWDSHQPLAEQLLDAGHQAKPLFLVTQMQRKGCGEGSSAERGAWPRPLRTQPGGGRWRAQGISTQQSPAVADWA